MNDDTNNCPHCGAKPMIHSYVCGTTFPNIAGNCSISEICKLNNEVARLRELLGTAIEIAEWLIEGYEPLNDSEEIRLIKSVKELDKIKNKL